MIERAAKAVDREVAAASAYARDTDTWMCWNNEKIARVALEAALDRRTGPKDRRVEWDDTVDYANRDMMFEFGRRRGDKSCLDLPRKSDRLKREAEERCKLTPVNIACPNCSKRFEFFISCGGTP